MQSISSSTCTHARALKHRHGERARERERPDEGEGSDLWELDGADAVGLGRRQRGLLKPVPVGVVVHVEDHLLHQRMVCVREREREMVESERIGVVMVMVMGGDGSPWLALLVNPTAALSAASAPACAPRSPSPVQSPQRP
jgi:hypothetical protein